MNAQATKLQAAENDLKRLMADVTRAMQKAQEAVAKMASNATTAEVESMIASPIRPLRVATKLLVAPSR